MPPSQTRSRSGCLTCKSKRKKCDETRPNCQRCERAGLQCPGYANADSKPVVEGEYVKYWTKPAYSIPPQSRTAPSKIPRRFASGSSAGNGETPSSSLDHSAGSRSLSPEQDYDMAAQREDTVVGAISSNLFDFSAPISDTPDEFSLDNAMWNLDPMFPSPPHAPANRPTSAIPDLASQQFMSYLPIPQMNEDSVFLDFQLSSLVSDLRPAGFNPLEATGGFSHLSETSSLQTTSTSQYSSLVRLPPALPLVQRPSSLHLIGRDQEGPEAVKRVIFDSLTLDRNAESNSLPFVLESYANWIERIAFNPLKVARRSRDLILKHYRDSDDSRWTITLFANVFNKLATSKVMGEVWGPSYLPTISALVGRVRQSLTVVKSRYGPPREADMQGAVKALDNTLEMVSIYYITSRMDWGLELMEEAAPIFRLACPDPPDKPIHLQSLLLQPIESLRHYAVVDILTSVSMDRPMFFQYDTAFYPELGSSVLSFTEDVGLQWSHGIPDPVVLVFARISTLRHSSIWDVQVIDELEAIVRDFLPIPSVSPEPFLTIARMVVQECWRQAAYIYLYMGLCRVDAGDLRVAQALSRFTKLLDSVKPGRVPDSFIMLNLIVAGVAARQQDDRQTIRQRMIGVEKFRYKGANALSRLELIWEVTDTEGRPAVWADLKNAYMSLLS